MKIDADSKKAKLIRAVNENPALLRKFKRSRDCDSVESYLREYCNVRGIVDILEKDLGLNIEVW